MRRKMPKIRRKNTCVFLFYATSPNFRNTKSLALRKNLYICTLKITPLGKTPNFWTSKRSIFTLQTHIIILNKQ